MKYNPLKLIGLFLATFAIVACQNIFVFTPETETPPLRFSYSLWPGYFPLEIAAEKGFFTEQGVNVDLVHYESYSKVLSHIGMGEYQGLSTTLGGILSLIESQNDLQIVMVSDRSAGADVLLANSQINTVSDLKGKRIGAFLGDFGELFVTEILEKSNISPDAVTFVNADGKDVSNYIQTGKIDAGMTWEPYITEGLNQGHKLLVSTKDMPEILPSVVVFRNSVIRDRPDDIQAFIRAWFQAQDYWIEHPEECQEIIARRLNISPQDVSIQGIDLVNLQENQRILVNTNSDESLYSTLQLYVDFSIRKGALGRMPNPESLINPNFINKSS